MKSKDGSYVALTKCFYCGESNEILMSTNFSDISHLNNKVVNKNPCPKCEDLMNKGVILIEVRDGEIESENPYRTGRFFCITLDYAKRLNIDVDKVRCSFIPEKISKQIGLHDIPTT